MKQMDIMYVTDTECRSPLAGYMEHFEPSAGLSNRRFCSGYGYCQPTIVRGRHCVDGQFHVKRARPIPLNRHLLQRTIAASTRARGCCSKISSAARIDDAFGFAPIRQFQVSDSAGR